MRSIFATLAVAVPLLAEAVPLETTLRHQIVEGSDDRGTPARPGDITDGTLTTLSVKWQPSERWYLVGDLSRGRFSYNDPRNPSCPATTGLFIRPFFFCTAAGGQGPGEVEDRLRGGGVRVGHKRVVGDRYELFGELGLVRWEWSPVEDLEALALTRCLRFDSESDFDSAVLNPDCATVADEASATGFAIRLGGQRQFHRRVRFRVEYALDSKQYQIFRNDAIPRFVAENCPDSFNCQTRELQLVDDRRRGTSSWFAAEMQIGLTSALAITLTGEAGGTRDWTGYGVGVRWTF